MVNISNPKSNDFFINKKFLESNCLIIEHAILKSNFYQKKTKIKKSVFCCWQNHVEQGTARRVLNWSTYSSPKKLLNQKLHLFKSIEISCQELFFYLKNNLSLMNQCSNQLKTYRSIAIERVTVCVRESCLDCEDCAILNKHLLKIYGLTFYGD